jgi:hypothetical protein
MFRQILFCFNLVQELVNKYILLQQYVHEMENFKFIS